MDCREIEERLPWYLHQSLAAAERAEVEVHLAGCARCREALDATRAASALFARHLSAAAIADYALGLPVVGVAREVVETHLAHCAECREEVALVESGSGVPAASIPVAAASAAAGTKHRAWPLALAAAVALASALGVWFAARSGVPASQGRVALVELLPESSRTRGAEADLPRVDATLATTLLLATDRAETFDEVRVRLRPAAGGAQLWEETGLLAAAGGAYALLLPAGAVAEGEVAIELEGRLGAEWTPLGRYRVRVAAASSP